MPQALTSPQSVLRRTSHEVRGLKYNLLKAYSGDVTSHLTRGAWIEIQIID